jgi:myo-inositol-1(or 4)-monophosphatase
MKIEKMNNFHSQVISVLNMIKDDIGQKFDQIFVEQELLEIKEKGDRSLVTNIDLFISDLFKKHFMEKFPELHFYSEEDQHSWGFPLIILDPIDGTRELSKGVGECAVSFGIYFSYDFEDPRNISWIYNPFTGMEVNSIDHTKNMNRISDKTLFSYVSRSEFEKGLYNNLKHGVDDLVFLPKGSIALKLGLLSGGCGHFVITKKPKNIWDIAAGTHICLNRGIKLYQNGKRISRITKETFENDLIWVSDTFKERVLSCFE